MLNLFKKKVYVSTTKPYILFERTSMHKSIIAWHNHVAKSDSALSTATMLVDVEFFIRQDISFKVVMCHTIVKVLPLTLVKEVYKNLEGLSELDELHTDCNCRIQFP